MKPCVKAVVLASCYAWNRELYLQELKRYYGMACKMRCPIKSYQYITVHVLNAGQESVEMALVKADIGFPLWGNEREWGFQSLRGYNIKGMMVSSPEELAERLYARLWQRFCFVPENKPAEPSQAVIDIMKPCTQP